MIIEHAAIQSKRNALADEWVSSASMHLQAAILHTIINSNGKTAALQAWQHGSGSPLSNTST